MVGMKRTMWGLLQASSRLEESLGLLQNQLTCILDTRGRSKEGAEEQVLFPIAKGERTLKATGGL